MILSWLPDLLAVCRLDPGADVPGWARGGSFLSITRTPGELSIVCDEDRLGEDVRCVRGWRALEVAGPLDLGMVGVLSSIAGALAKDGISLFAVSTFETDYILVRREDMERAEKALRSEGHEVR